MSHFNTLILGYGEHGKDQFAEYLSAPLRLRTCSSSYFACQRVIYPWFCKALPSLYETIEQCYEDRRNWRACWHYLISQYNAPDKTKLASELLKTHDVYIGMRCKKEVLACRDKKLFNFYFWVDASQRKSPESAASNSIHFDPSYMVRIDNNGSLDDLKKQALQAAALMRDGDPDMKPRWPRLATDDKPDLPYYQK